MRPSIRQLVRAQSIPTSVSASNPFDKYKREKKQDVRAPDVKKDKKLTQLIAAWKKFRLEEDGKIWYPTTFNKIRELLKGINYSTRDVEKFSVAIAEFQQDEDLDYDFGILRGYGHEGLVRYMFATKAGAFLSVLINNCPDSDFVIHTSHLDPKPDYLCSENTKNVTIIGDVGNWFADSAKGGLLIIEGNAAGWVGRGIQEGVTVILKGNASSGAGTGIWGGKLIVEGNALGLIGCEMGKGSILIKGNGGNAVGLHMKGGEVHIEGEYESLGETIYGGKIYHRAKLIYPKVDKQK